MGAKVIAVMPVTSPLPEIQAREVQLTAAGDLTDVLAPYVDLFTNTFDNFNSIVQGVVTEPFPFAQEVIANQIGYLQTIGTAASKLRLGLQ